MKKHFLLLLIGFQLSAGLLSAQIQFEDKTILLSSLNHYSGVAIAVLDMNGDGLDDIVRMNQATQMSIEYQTAPNQPFTHLTIGPIPDGAWGMCAADVDNNGYPDILTGGAYDDIKVLMANGTGSAYNLDILDEPGTFVQGVNFADINNDGWLDAFVCHDDGAARIFANDGAGNLSLEPMWVNLATVPVSDNSGNYGSVWSDIDNDGDLDFYIAKCRQGVNDPLDPRRINQLFLNNGDGTYKQDTANTSGLRIGAQSWTADFGDIDNDGDFDCFITNHDVSSQLLENDGSGHFTDISIDAGILNIIEGLPIQGVFRDFDNDGFVDILVAGSDPYFFRNNGDKTFELLEGLFDNNPMESYALGDLNHDGFQDIYAGYAEPFNDPSLIPDALWLNAGNNNHFFCLNLRGVQSNRNGVGAKITVYSALGTQVREVRSGESYGIMNSMQIHFGLGQADIDSVKINWPSGTVDVLYQPAVDQYITVEEGGCIVLPVNVVANGPVTICSGDSVAIGVDGLYSAYTWSTGDTTANITVKTSGNYFVTITTAEGCTAVSNGIAVTVDPVQIPVISASGDTVFCGGNSVELTASAAAAYTWSTGANTQSITVFESGDYSVTAQGLCAQFQSETVHITALANAAPDVNGDTIATAQSALLTASGDQAQWYDAPTGGNLLNTGPTYLTAPLDTNTTYWVSNTTVYDSPNQFTGMADHQGTPFGDPQFNGAIIFDCYQPVRLAKVKVYSNTAGNRKIDLRNSTGDVLQTTTINIGQGTSVISLDFDIPAGNDLVLLTDESQNITSFGTLGPLLRRSTQGVAYPYEIPNVLSLKNSNFGVERYYYFYNWEVDFYGYECTSDRVPVTVVVDPTLGSAAPEWADGLRIYPNPVSEILNTELEGFAGNNLSVSIRNAQGVMLQQRQIEVNAGKTTFQTNLSTFPKGIYWIELSGDQGTVRRKIVVQ